MATVTQIVAHSRRFSASEKQLRESLQAEIIGQALYEATKGPNDPPTPADPNYYRKRAHALIRRESREARAVALSKAVGVLTDAIHHGRLIGPDLVVDINLRAIDAYEKHLSEGVFIPGGGL